MNTTTSVQTRACRWATVAAVAGIATAFPAVATAGPQPIATPVATRQDDARQRSTVDDEYRKTVNHATFRPCFIIQPHWNPAYDGFVPECDQAQVR